jgi:hypothetical protein
MTPAKQILATATFSAALIATAAIAQPAPPVMAGAKLTTILSGAAEVPGPGDPDGSGKATITVNPGQSRICWEIQVKDIDPATAAHIHIGLAGTAPADNVVLGLSAPTDGDSEGCETVERSLADAIRKSPASYYVNVHNAAYPNGALRGQLG